MVGLPERCRRVLVEDGGPVEDSPEGREVGKWDGEMTGSWTVETSPRPLTDCVNAHGGGHLRVQGLSSRVQPRGILSRTVHRL